MLMDFIPHDGVLFSDAQLLAGYSLHGGKP